MSKISVLLDAADVICRLAELALDHHEHIVSFLQVVHHWVSYMLVAVPYWVPIPIQL
jgi:hypothetical protein